MADPVSAAGGASFSGPAASIRDLGATGMITIRGDFADERFAGAVQQVLGAPIPGVRRMEPCNDGGLAWMSPDELLLVTSYAKAGETLAALSKALEGVHHLVADVSDARTVLKVSGAGARELLASGAPVDLSPGAFGPGDLRRTQFGQIAAAFWCCGDGSFQVVCFRSLGLYLMNWLKTAAKSGARPQIF